MRVNLDWLRDWVDFDLEAAQLADLLTTSGLEVDAVLPVAGSFDRVVVAEVVACKGHTGADRLTVCEVRDGRATQTVVCGAPNVRPGLKVAFAQLGARLPGGRVIEAAEIRGVASAGMLCSARELEIGEDGAGILELPQDAEIGVDVREVLRLDDEILDIDLTPNRGDCFSVIGIAREIAAGLGEPMRNVANAAVPAATTDRFPVRLDAPDGCPRFVGRVVRNVGRGVSPTWLVERLRRSGVRAIHPVVDVTNYVMLELGQPLHAYDLSRLADEISVRYAAPGERLTLLDGREIGLAADVVVIADRSGPIGLAGIMGGHDTAVEAGTRDIFLEAAYFPPPALAGRARRYGLHTDASTRFERGVDPEHQARAIERATALLLDITGGDAGPVIETVAPDHLPQAASIRLRGDRIAALLGHALSPETVERSLETLGMSVVADGSNRWRVTPPSYRFDLSIEEDLVEEVARRVGYDALPAIPELAASQLGAAIETRVDIDRIADLLAAQGYSEAICYTFVDPTLAEAINPGADHSRLVNPISQELSVLRRSLWPGLLSAAAQNSSRQQDRLRLFEVGAQFETLDGSIVEKDVLAGLVCGSRWPEQWASDRAQADFFDVKHDVESVLSLAGRAASLRFIAGEHPALRPGRSARILLDDGEAGWIGELHPSLQQRFDLKYVPILFSLELEKITTASLPVYRRSSKFPSIRRDLAIVVAHDVPADSILTCVRNAAGDLLKNVNVFDVYRGPGIDSSRKSIGLGLILQDTYRTLTDEDADRTVAAVVERLGSELGATIRI